MKNTPLRRPAVPGTTALLNAARPTCEAHFYRWDRATPQVVKLDANNKIGGDFEASNKERPVMVVNNDIVRCSVNKDKGSHAGSFSMLLKAGKVGKDTDEYSTKPMINYIEKVSPGDWVIIYMSKTDTKVGKKNIKMLGIVEKVTIEEVDNPQTGVPSQYFSITGKDFGKVFETQIFHNPVMNAEQAATYFGADFLSDSLKIVGASATPTPDEVIKALVSFYYGGLFSKKNTEHELWYIPPSLAAYFGVDIQTKTKPSFIDIFDYTTFVGLAGGQGISKGKLPGNVIIQNLPASGSIWQVLSYYSNAALNELFCDLDFTPKGLKPSLIFRQLPYSVSSGNLKISTSVPAEKRSFLHALRRTSFDSSIIKRKSLSMTDAERINHIVVVPRIETPYPEAYKSAINPPSVQRHGLRSLVVETPYAANKSEAFVAYCNLCVDLLSEWFFNSERYYNGVVSVEGLDEHVSVGSNIYISDIKQLFHVEGYTHTYEQFASGNISFVSDFSVIRGCYEANNVLNAIDTMQSTTVVKSVLENIPGRKL
jgi:hypothetical protein